MLVNNFFVALLSFWFRNRIDYFACISLFTRNDWTMPSTAGLTRALGVLREIKSEDGVLDLASGTDFAQRLFFGKPRSELASGTWYFDHMLHRVVVLDRLRSPSVIGHVTGEMRNGDATNALFDRVPEGTIVCITQWRHSTRISVGCRTCLTSERPEALVHAAGLRAACCTSASAVGTQSWNRTSRHHLFQ
jgi:hypothetical protein